MSKLYHYHFQEEPCSWRKDIQKPWDLDTQERLYTGECIRHRAGKAFKIVSMTLVYPYDDEEPEWEVELERTQMGLCHE